MLVAWNDSLKTGHAGIDNQHKILISLFNRLAEVTSQGNGQEEVGKVLSSLSIYVVVHFKMEEELMKDINFPGADEHIHSHATMKQQVEKLIENFNCHKLEQIKLFDILQHWIEYHVKTKDLLLAEFFKVNKFSEKAI